jgi:RNA-directed DNA polymerase
MQQDYADGKIGEKEIIQSIQSWFAHLEHGDTWQLRQQILASLVLPESVYHQFCC